MKTIKINDVEVSVDELRKVINDNPDLLKPITVSKGKYFFPKKGEKCFCVHTNGIVSILFPRNLNDFINMGVYATKEEA